MTVQSGGAIDELRRYEQLVAAVQSRNEKKALSLIKSPFGANTEISFTFGLALEWGNMTVFEALCKKWPKSVLLGIKRGVVEFGASITATTRKKMLEIAHPFLAAWSLPEHLSEEELGEWSYIVYLLTVKELAALTLPPQLTDPKLGPALTNGLCWALEFPLAYAGKRQKTSWDFPQKVEWMLANNLVTEKGKKRVLTLCVTNKNWKAAEHFLKHAPALKALNYELVNSIFCTHSHEQLEQFAPFLAHHNLAYNECAKIINKWTEYEYPFKPREYGFSGTVRPKKELSRFKIMRPFFEVLAKESATKPFNDVFAEVSPFTAQKIKEAFPFLEGKVEIDLRTWGNGFVGSEKLALEKFEEMHPTHRSQYIAARLCSSKGGGGNPTWFNLSPTDYTNAEVVSAVFDTNRQLVMKCLSEGGVVSSIEQWLTLAQWCSKQTFLDVWTYAGRPSLFSEKDEDNKDELCEKIMASPLIETLMELDAQVPWMKRLSATEWSNAAETAVKHNRHSVLERILQTTPMPISRGSRLLALALDQPLDLMKMMVNYIDPHADSSEILSVAVDKNKKEFVEFLLPLCNPQGDDSLALFRAVQQENIEMVATLLPHSCPKDANSRALHTALKRRHKEIALLLWPLSNVEHVKQKIEANDEEEVQLFFDECAAHLQRENLERSLREIHKTKDEDAEKYTPVSPRRI